MRDVRGKRFGSNGSDMICWKNTKKAALWSEGDGSPVGEGKIENGCTIRVAMYGSAGADLFSTGCPMK